MAEWWQSVIQNRKLGGKLPSVDWSKFAEIAFGGVLLSYVVGIGNLIQAGYGALAQLVRKPATFVETIPAVVSGALGSLRPVMVAAAEPLLVFGPAAGPIALVIALTAIWIVMRGT